jgi:hypothetical protein
VAQNPSTIIAGSGPNPSNFGQPVTFTATVTGSGGTPTGPVTFMDGRPGAVKVLGTPLLDSSGRAKFITSSLNVGGRYITAAYDGDSNFSGSSEVWTQTVNALRLTTTITALSAPNPSSFGQPVTFFATVTGGGSTPTGTVTFTDNFAGTYWTASLDDRGQAMATISSIGVGSRWIAFTYGGDSNYYGSGGKLTQTVTSTSTTTLTSVPNPSTVGQSVTFTATVTGTDSSVPPVTPTGTVVFADGATELGTASIVPPATFTTSSLTVGNHAITATYGGDSVFSGSSGTVTQNVSQAGGTRTALASSKNPSELRNPVTFTATVTPIGGSGTPTGTVTFKDRGHVLGTAPLNRNGQAKFTTSSLPVGTQIILAIYNGDANFAPSPPAELAQTVVAARQ